jgi:hydroxymethylpyrimidine/phosphomethylpyrimidine kinase
MPTTPPVVLTIAGFDPSSGAGVTADIKTIAAHGCYGVAGITALTVQSTAGVRRMEPVTPRLLTGTLEELASDLEIAAVHIGMLASEQGVDRVAAFLRKRKLPNVVLDPILRSSSGAALLSGKGIRALVRKLLPLATVATPNLDEAAFLTELPVGNLEQMGEAANRLHSMGAAAVVVTGGHLKKAIDVLSIAGASRTRQWVFEGEHQESKSTHGTGCAFSTAIASQLARGSDLPEAVRLAKAYVADAIANAYSLGRGIGPVNHLYGMPPFGTAIRPIGNRS